MLHHHHMLGEQHAQLHPLMRQQLAAGMHPQINPVFQTVWGIPPGASLKEIQETVLAQHQEAHEGEQSIGAAVAVDHSAQHPGHQRDHLDQEEKMSAARHQPSTTEEGIWDIPSTEPEHEPEEHESPATQAMNADQPSQSSKKKQSRKRGGKQQQQQPQKQTVPPPSQASQFPAFIA